MASMQLKADIRNQGWHFVSEALRFYPIQPIVKERLAKNRGQIEK
jgi:hypothetical protein